MWIYFNHYDWDHNPYSVVVCVDQTECQVSVEVYDIFYTCIIYWPFSSRLGGVNTRQELMPVG